jgi:hypothetical protein
VRRTLLLALLLPALLGGWLIGKPPATPYTGPGDYASFTAWWGLRAYSAAAAATGTQPAMDLRRVSDNATCTAKIGTDGNLDLTVGTPCNGGTQTVTAWIGASSARVSKLYDQTSGNACGGASCDLVQATAGNQPTLNLTGGGGSGARPYISVGPIQGSARLEAANNYTTDASEMMSISVVANQFSNTTITHFLCANDLNCLTHSGVNQWASNVTGTATDNVWHAANAAEASATPSDDVMNIDGTETTSTGSVVADSTQPYILYPTETLAGLAFGEGGFQDAAKWSGTVRTNLCHNQRLYWGTGGSC